MGSTSPKRTLALLLALLLISLALILQGPKAARHQHGSITYVITLRHYGVEGREMERTVAIPLEDALSNLAGVEQIITTSEQGKVRAVVRFSGDTTGSYEAVRDVAQRVYETLPPSAQRPELSSSRDSRVPVWSAAVFFKNEEDPSAQARLEENPSVRTWSEEDTSAQARSIGALQGSAIARSREFGRGSATAPGSGISLGNLLERVVKPAFERIEGAGEVELAGTGRTELVISLDEKTCAAMGIPPWSVAQQLAEQDVLLPAGTLQDNTGNVLIRVDGRFTSRDALSRAPIRLPGGSILPLSSLGKLYEQDRKPETIARLNGKETAVISIMGSSAVGLGKLTRGIRETLQSLAQYPLEFHVLSDRGAEEEKAFRGVLSATVMGSGLVALAGTLFSGGFSLMGILSVPLIMWFSAALLAFIGFPLDRLSLAGLACGVGAAVDSTILVMERLRGKQDLSQKVAALSSLAPSLFASVATTVVALFPLALIGSDSTIVSSIAWGIGSTSVVALLFSLGILPAFVGIQQKPQTIWFLQGIPQTVRFLEGNKVCISSKAFFASIKRKCLRCFGRMLILSYRHPLYTLGMFVAFSFAGVIAIVLAGADVATLPSEDSVFAQIEFEGGLIAERVDELSAEYATLLGKHAGITSVQTSARTASASALISFDPQKISLDRVRDLARTTSIYGGFVFIPEASSRDRLWTITVYGDDDQLCRDIVKDLARSLQASPLIQETVFNFKEGSPRLYLKPDGERMVAGGLTAAIFSDTLRRAVFGPVIYKRLTEQGETDVRLRFASNQYLDRTTLFRLPLSITGNQATGTQSIETRSVVRVQEDREPASIRRENRRRLASLSIRTKPMDPRLLRDKLMPLVTQTVLPPGYTIEFDREAIRNAERLSRMGLYFILSLVFCFMVIAASTESFGAPLIILGTVPPAMALPALVVFLSGAAVDLALACAFVAVSGIAVNGAVLAVEALREEGRPSLGGSSGTSSIWIPYKALRRRLSSLAATSLTTILGALPMLFLSGGANQMVRSLALVNVLGVTVSFFESLSLIPALVRVWPGFTSPRNAGIELNPSV